MRASLILLSVGLIISNSACVIEAHSATTQQVQSDQIKWEPWTDDLFERARKENKFVVLDLEAVWCHWCHVMDEKTYSNPAVIQLMKSKFIAVRVDQDSRPDLANKYEDYGWPATIFFNSDGTELVKRAGFIRPDEMTQVLEAIIRDPTPGPSAKKAPEIEYASKAGLTSALRDELNKKHVDGYDTKYGAWSTNQKFLDADSVEYALTRAKSGNTEAAHMARTTLDQQINLLDPVWGGMYQYSTDGDWVHPHFEKIMQIQGENLKVYAMGYSLFQDVKHLQAAQSIYNYLTKFLLSPEGAFYTSQDADIVQGQHSDWYYKLSDAERRKHGVPRIDKHIYARENGWAINGAAWLYKATGDKQYLDTALKAANWIIANRNMAGGGFRHDATDSGGPYLGDTLYMGRAFLTLYEVTGDRAWLKRAQEAGDFIAAHFKQQKNKPGLLTAELKPNAAAPPEPLLDENVVAARFFNLLQHYSGKAEYKEVAENAMRYLSTPAIAHKRRVLVAGILLADQELNTEPVHITIVGGKADAGALVLFKEALRYPLSYKQVEWLDHKEGPLPNAAAELPNLPKPAAFGCAFGRCSIPIYDAARISKTIDSFANAKKEVE